MISSIRNSVSYLPVTFAPVVFALPLFAFLPLGQYRKELSCVFSRRDFVHALSRGVSGIFQKRLTASNKGYSPESYRPSRRVLFIIT